MCGIYARISRYPRTKNYYKKIKHRGPDASLIKEFQINEFYITLVFHRLSIMGLDQQSTTILEKDNVYLICNGEIYNYQELMEKHNYTPTTHSDCESILAVYLNSPKTIEENLETLDGVFSFIILDLNNNHVFVARDRLGVRPLFYKKTRNTLEFSSEAKGLISKKNYKIRPFPPGKFAIFSLYDVFIKPVYWTKKFSVQRIGYSGAKNVIKELLTESVNKRLHPDRPMGFLLSGGLDSSLIAGIANKLVKEKITTFSIGFDENSPDLIKAREVAKFLGSDHHEVIYSLEEIRNCLEDLIYTLETYDITTVRASLPMYLLSKYISENTNVKVLFSGEGADEIFGGYIYLQKAPTFEEFQKELESLTKHLYLFDVLRADRTTARWGLELRVPFLDSDFYNFVMGLDPTLKKTNPEKQILRNAFQSENLIPETVLNRKKEAFSDGVGVGSVTTLKELGADYETRNVSCKYTAKPETGEAKMYYSIFKKLFRGYNNTLFYWMPKWSPEANGDPSATVLENY